MKHFHDVRRIWAIVGTLVIGIGLAGIVAAITLPALLGITNNALNKAMILKYLSTVQQAALMNEARKSFRIYQ